jgi:hypothetical protein
MPRIRLDKTTAPDTATTDASDTEGNGSKFPEPAVDGDDTEGASFRGHVTDGVQDDDTEGAGFRGHLTDGVEDDDTEGNTLKSGRSVPPAANPGRSTPPNV